MKGENRKSSRREAAIVRRLKNLEKYVDSKDVDKIKKAYNHIAGTCQNLGKEIPSEARAFLNKLGLKEGDILTAKTKVVKEENEALPEDVVTAPD